MRHVVRREITAATTVQLPVDLDDWLRTYCAREGLTLRAVFVAALVRHRDVVDPQNERASAEGAAVA